MLKKYFYTFLYLKISQIFCQIRKRFVFGKTAINKDNLKNDINFSTLRFNFPQNFQITNTYLGNSTFEFLNLKKVFQEDIDWNFLDYGKLWSYNLEYFNYIFQDNITIDEKVRLIDDFYSFSIQYKKPLEPYPVSLRSINLIKFTLTNNLDKQGFHKYLYYELEYLHANYEFHLLGNHVLENAFALCLGGAFFLNEQWHRRAIKILRKELDEQILADGAHFELSSMYHNIIFFRLLELVDWYSSYDQRQNEFLSFCRQKASLMLDWLENIKFQNGDIPLFNDAANGIAYDTSFLLEYAKRLGIQRTNIPLGASGYRSFENGLYEIKIDLAQIGASYQPGHAHSDALSFVLYYRGESVFVEQGTSTYQIGERRDLERSTEAHNTVVVNGKNQSEVWGGFRVGKRAKTTILRDGDNILEAMHDGYKSDGIIHRRKFVFENKKIIIYDMISGPKNRSVAFFHLSPHIKIMTNERSFNLNNNVVCLFEGADSISIEQYKYADQYNQYQNAERFVISFENDLITTVDFNER